MMTGNIPKPCVCASVRRTARRLARTYDSALAGSGINVTQFAVMRAVERHENEPLSRVADDLAMERTSLYRALALLERNNWIKLKSGRDNRSRCASISGLGRKALDRAQPDWAHTQSAIVEKFGRDRWAHLVTEMQQLSQCAADLERGMAKREVK